MHQGHLPSTESGSCSESSKPSPSANSSNYASHNGTYKHTKNTIRKQYTNQYKQYKKTLQNCCMRYNDRMSIRIAKNGVKTSKLWPKQCSRGLFAKKIKRTGALVKKPRVET